VYGHSGDDVIESGIGRDTIEGHEDQDWLFGGPGADDIFGGSGSDTIVYDRIGQSGLSWDTADWIGGFRTSEDKIDGDVLGTTSNYRAAQILNRGFEAAEVAAILNMWTYGSHYVFVSDGEHGYLFVDFNRNGIPDSGVILGGLTSSAAFSHLDII
jgi:Ca2+-binding RTX toxin-like protein